MSTSVTNNMSKVKEFLEIQQKQNKDRITNDLNTVFNTLVVEAENDKAKIPEPIFREHFLPYFKGERDDGQIVRDWVAIAGSHMSKVDVVAQNGDVLFTVPPIYDSSIIDNVKRNLGESFSDIYSQYELHSNNLPVVGERFLADAFNNKLPKMLKPSEQLNENHQAWKKIIDYYDGNTNSNSSTSAAQAPTDDVEYD